MADQVHRASDRRPEGNQAHTCGSQPGRRRRVNGEQRRKAPHRVRSSHRCWQTYTSTTSSISWAHQWRRRYATGNVVMVRYADDIVIGFDKRYDARRFRIAMQRRLREFGLTVHPRNPSDGVRPLRCRKPCHQGKRQTRNVQLPGFTHISGKDRNGRFMLIRKTRRDRMTATLESHQRRSAKALALLNPRTGKMAQESGSGYLNYHWYRATSPPCRSSGHT